MVEKTNNKEIIALDIFEAVRLRPTMYISQVSLMDDKIPIIKNNTLCLTDKSWSPGFMHLIIEILENALDEAKRMKGKMKNIWININLDTNEVSIKDEGGGFHKANSKHSKTKKNVIRTAFEDLHAGSNFVENNDTPELLGTYGIGAAVCNILSEYFEVITVNKTHYVQYIWNDYKVVKEKRNKKTPEDKLGTEVKFIPTKEVFKDLKWDKELIETYLSFKQFLINKNKALKNLKLNGNFIEKGNIIPIKITTDFLPKENIQVDSTEYGTIIIWPSYENSCSVSFVNGSQCIGIHQKIVNDWLNEYFKYNLAHHFYEILFLLNVPSNLMKFADQNKTKYAISKIEIEEILENAFKSKLLRSLKGSKIEQEINKKIDERLYSENIKVIKKAGKTSKRIISEKYSPASKHKESIYLTEGLCLEENNKIFIIRKNKILDCKLKNIKIGDLVITHLNSLKPINNINKSIKNAIQIKTSLGYLICSENHKWFVYDKSLNEFYFENTNKLNKNKHQLIKNYLSFLESFDEIKKIDKTTNNIKIINDKLEEWFIAKTDTITVYDIENNKFLMKNAIDLNIGDILSKFLIK